MYWNFDSDYDNELTVDLMINTDDDYICQNALFPRRYDTIIRYPEHKLTFAEQIKWVDDFLKTSKGRHLIFTNSPIIFNYFNVCMQRFLSKVNLDKAINPEYLDVYENNELIKRANNGLFTSDNPFNKISQIIHNWQDNLHNLEMVMKQNILNKMAREN